MNTYTHNKFAGSDPTQPSGAVVVAESRLQAKTLLESALASAGLAQPVNAIDFVKVDTTDTQVVLLAVSVIN
jgi:hypothetical protein